MHFYSDVIVIGGGIMGTSASLFLRQRGMDVMLLERGLTGQHASGTNFGNLRRQGRPLEQLPIANRAHEIWDRSDELLKTSVEYAKMGHIRVSYGQHDVDNMERYAQQAKDYGLNLEMLRGAELFRRFPYLSREVLAGSWSPEDGHANPRIVSPAFANAAKEAGARIFENTHAVIIEKPGDDFVVTAEDGRRFVAPLLLITTGAWGDMLSKQMGEPVPMTSRNPTMSVTEPVPYCIKPSIGVFTSVEKEGVYFRQIPRGNIIIGGSTRGPGYPNISRAYVNPENTLSQFEHVKRILPRISGLNVIRVWSGTEGYLRDGLPVMGLSSTTNGLYYAFGFSGTGFQIGPGVGSIMAELIHTGRTDIVLDPFRIDRFQPDPHGLSTQLANELLRRDGEPGVVKA